MSRSCPLPAGTPTTPLLRRLFDEVRTGADFARLDDFVTPTCVFHHRGKDVSLAPDDLARIVRRWRAAFPDLRSEVLDVLVDGDRAAVRVTESSVTTMLVGHHSVH